MKWTSVKTRLPWGNRDKDPNDGVLACNVATGRIWLETMHSSWWNRKSLKAPPGFDSAGPRITHWMALPKPPRVALPGRVR